MLKEKLERTALTYRGYTTHLKHNPQETMWQGNIEGIKEVVSFEGKDYRSAVEAFIESVDDYKYDLIFLGRNRPKNRLQE